MFSLQKWSLQREALNEVKTVSVALKMTTSEKEWKALRKTNDPRQETENKII